MAAARLQGPSSPLRHPLPGPAPLWPALPEPALLRPALPERGVAEHSLLVLPPPWAPRLAVLPQSRARPRAGRRVLQSLRPAAESRAHPASPETRGRASAARLPAASPGQFRVPEASTRMPPRPAQENSGASPARCRCLAAAEIEWSASGRGRQRGRGGIRAAPSPAARTRCGCPASSEQTPPHRTGRPKICPHTRGRTWPGPDWVCGTRRSIWSCLFPHLVEERSRLTLQGSKRSG